MKKMIKSLTISAAIIATFIITAPLTLANGTTDSTTSAGYTCSINGAHFDTLEQCQGSGACESTNTSGSKIQGLCTYGLVVTPGYINTMIQKYTQWFMAIVGSIAVIMIIWAGLKYIMAKGDPKNTESARKMIMYALIGLAIVLLAGGAMWTITSLLNVGT